MSARRDDRIGLDRQGWPAFNPFISGPESPSDEEADAFARAAIFAICSTGVSASLGRRTYGRCLAALAMGGPARMGFRHPLKAEAIDRIWRERESLYRRYRSAADKGAALQSVPGIGPVTARRLGVVLGLFEDGPDLAAPRLQGQERRAATEHLTGVATNAP